MRWDHCGMARNAEGLQGAREKVREIRDEFWQNATVAGTAGEFNQVLERAGRVACFDETKAMRARGETELPPTAFTQAAADSPAVRRAR